MNDAAPAAMTAIVDSGAILILARLLLIFAFWPDALLQLAGFRY